MIKEEVAKELQLASKSKDFLFGKINCIDVFLSDIYVEAIAGFHSSSLLTRLYSVYNVIHSLLVKQKFNNAPPADIVFIPVALNHLDQMIPIVKELIKSGHSVLFLVNRINLARILSRYAYPVYWLSEPSIFFSRHRAPQKVLSAIPTEYIQRSWPVWSKKISIYSKAYDYIEQVVKPKVVCVGYDITFEGRLACRFFSSKSIPTVCIQHGDMSGILNSEHIVDEFYVYGEDIRQTLSRRNKEGRTTFVVTGAPYLDGRELPATTHPKKVPALLGCPVNKPYVLVAFSGPGNNTSIEHHRKLIEAVYALNRDMPELTLVIKLHPKDRMEYYDEVNKHFPQQTVHVLKNIPGHQHLSIFDWLSGCSVLLTGASTTAVEALLCEIPVITLDLQQEYKGISFIDREATLHVTQETALVPAVERLVYDSAFRKEMLERATPFLDDYFFLRDHRAATRCAERITQLMRKKPCAE